ncbi:MAG TPA: GNAT family N-acetyltransferase [Thermotogota bacterium]|nr:GNAT family N-acetyltransferase [Thermotogota bacterium]
MRYLAFSGGSSRDFYVIFCLTGKSPGENQILMDGIVVDKAYSGKGVGTALFKALELYAVQEGFKSIKLDVIDENSNAGTDH